jgi:hypothetical protein
LAAKARKIASCTIWNGWGWGRWGGVPWHAAACSLTTWQARTVAALAPGRRCQYPDLMGVSGPCLMLFGRRLLCCGCMAATVASVLLGDGVCQWVIARRLPQLGCCSTCTTWGNRASAGFSLVVCSLAAAELAAQHVDALCRCWPIAAAMPARPVCNFAGRPSDARLWRALMW